MTQKIELTIIGYVRSPIQEKTDTNWGQVISRIDVEPAYQAGLTGLAAFSHALVVTWLHEARFDPDRHLIRHPRGRTELPLSGIFAQRAKDRPNPIGITAVKIVQVTPEWLEVQGLDAIDGTPVLDIKPYFPHFDRVEGAAVPEWVEEIMQNYF